MDRPKLYGVVMTVLCVTACSAGQPPQQERGAGAAVQTATVEEVPQRTMTVKNVYHAELFPFHKGEPFVVDPNAAGSIDFNTKPPLPQRSDEYYDYDTSKLEEVPYDYKGDPIDRKDVVVEPGFPRPNDIKPNKPKQTDIYKFLNLPKNYNNSDKFPLISSSYANTKVQGSGGGGGGGGSSSLSNHKMPAAPQTSPPPPPPPSSATSWHNNAAVRTTTASAAVVRPAATTTTVPISTTTTTTTTTTPVPAVVQEYEDDYYDYFHSQESGVAAVSSENHAAATTSAASPTTAATSAKHTAPTTTPLYTTSPAAAMVVTASAAYAERPQYADNAAVPVDKTTTTTTTARPEIDSKPDGTSFADYDDAIEPAEKERGQEYDRFRPIPAGNSYQFDEKTYPLITAADNGKVPMTFTAHVSSGISLNRKEHQNAGAPDVALEPGHSSIGPVRPEIRDAAVSQETATRDNDNPELPTGGNRPADDATITADDYHRHHRPTSAAADPHSQQSANKAPKPAGETDRYETVHHYHRVKPADGAHAPSQQYPPSAVPNRPANSPVHVGHHRQQPAEQPKTPATVVVNRVKPANAGELQASQVRPAVQVPLYPAVQLPAYPAVQSAETYAKTKPVQQYTPPPPPTKQLPDTSKFKPPKHVINHFIKTQPNEDNKSYALQTSFSIGMDAERTRPAQGIGQVLMVEDASSSESTAVSQTTPKSKPSTTSIPLVPPPRPPVQKPYPRPQWENVPKPPTYYPPPPPPPPPKRDNAQPAPRPNLPNILPQFRPNAKVDAPPPPPPPPQMVAQQSSHSATIERVQIPMDHLRPPPLPKPQFLKLERNDENVDEEILDIPEKETRILQRTGPQPAKVTTLQMIQHGAPAAKTRDEIKENPVHIVYAANSPPRPAEKLLDDSAILDVKDRSDVPVLKTKTNVNRPVVRTDFPYQIVKPEDNRNASTPLEYNAYSPTKADTVRPDNDHQQLVANIQDYSPTVTRRDPVANTAIPPQKPIAVTLKTSEDNHKTSVDEGRKPLLQNFQIPFQPSLKLPENSNGWSVVRKSPADSASERADDSGDTAVSTEKFDPDNFKPQLVGGFMPISSPVEEVKEKKTIEQPERAKRSVKD